MALRAVADMQIKGKSGDNGYLSRQIKGAQGYDEYMNNKVTTGKDGTMRKSWLIKTGDYLFLGDYHSSLAILCNSGSESRW